MIRRILSGLGAGVLALGAGAMLSTTASASTTSATLAPHVGGLMDRGNTSFKYGDTFTASAQQDYLNGDTFTVAWDAIEHGSTKPATRDFSMITDALQNLQGWSGQNHQRQLRLRIYAGTSAPTWVKNLDGGPVEFWNAGDPDRCPGGASGGCALQIPKYWTTDVRNSWNQMISGLGTYLDNYYTAHSDAVQIGEVTTCEAGFASCEPMLSFADDQGTNAHPNGYYLCQADSINPANPNHSGYNYDREKAIYQDYQHTSATLGSLTHWKPRVLLQVEPYQEIDCPTDGSTPASYKGTNDNQITDAFIDAPAGTMLHHDSTVAGGSFTLTDGGLQTVSPSLAVFFHTGLGPSITCYFNGTGCANAALQARLYAYILNLYVPSTGTQPRGSSGARYAMWGQTKPVKKLGDQWPDTLCFAVESGLMSVELPAGYTGFDTEDPTTCPYTYHGYTGTPPTGTAHDLLVWANNQTIANAAAQTP